MTRHRLDLAGGAGSGRAGAGTAASISSTFSMATRLDEPEARRQFWSDRAKELQHRSRAFGLFVALLSPLVALLSIQLLAFREAGPVAVALVSLELAAWRPRC